MRGGVGAGTIHEGMGAYAICGRMGGGEGSICGEMEGQVASTEAIRGAGGILSGFLRSGRVWRDQGVLKRTWGLAGIPEAIFSPPTLIPPTPSHTNTYLLSFQEQQMLIKLVTPGAACGMGFSAGGTGCSTAGRGQ